MGESQFLTQPLGAFGLIYAVIQFWITLRYKSLFREIEFLRTEFKTYKETAEKEQDEMKKEINELRQMVYGRRRG